MKKLNILVAGIAVFSLTSFPALACNLWAPHLFCPAPQPVAPMPHGAPAPMLAAGIPAYFALGSVVLMTKLLARRRGSSAA